MFAEANNGVSPLHRLLMETPLSTLGKAALAGCVIALAILAWAPAQAMTRTGLGGPAEHFVAWLGAAMVFGLTSRATAPLAAQCLLLMFYAAILECGQVNAPAVRPRSTTSRSAPAACCLAAPWSGWRAGVG